MNAQTAFLKLMAHFRPEPIVTTRTNPKTGKVSQRSERPATPLFRRADTSAPGTVAELVDTFVLSNRLSIPTREGETPAEAIIRMAATDGKIVLKTDKKDATKVLGAWLSQDAPIRKRRPKGERQRLQQAAKVDYLTGVLGESASDETPNVDDSDATQAEAVDEDEDTFDEDDDDLDEDEDDEQEDDDDDANA